ncbi:Uma2 family endonuclease [Streptomyces sp. NPDC047042]|uniref:Uma2 family endonuclease n=1 Tax=Streptomyces sp. NPDC047042 TaxID=3154807 RepID=UPI0033CC2DDB
MSVSPGAWMYPRPRPGNLREIAEKIEDATSLRVQILGGKLVMSPTPRGKRAGVVKQVRRQLEAVVLPDGLEDDDWLADAALAVEVVSQSEKSRDIRDKADWYAVVRVPVLLVIDLRNGTWTLHTQPDNGAYRDVLPGKFGESVLLPEPFGVEIVTDNFPVYGAAPRSSRKPWA